MCGLFNKILSLNNSELDQLLSSQSLANLSMNFVPQIVQGDLSLHRYPVSPIAGEQAGLGQQQCMQVNFTAMSLRMHNNINHNSFF